MISTQKTGKDPSFYPIIKKLQFEHQSPQLTQLIKNELGNRSISNGDLFYIKSEIKRKAKPCSRLIDLRSISNNAALSTFTWDKLAHVMDKPSAEHFIKLTRKYGGKYTFGVYEGVIDNFKSSKDKVKAEQLNHDVSIDKVSLCEVYRRHEERMNLGVKISVFPLAPQVETLEYSEIEAHIQSDLHKASNTTQVDGHTANISVNGLQIKLRKDFSVGEIIAIRFTGLEADFVFKQKYIAYQVVRSDLVEDGKVHLISLSQLDLETHNEFKQFTKKIIYANKKRYKVRLDNTLVSVRSKFYEQFYLSRRNALDLFTKRDGSLAYIFSSEPALDMIEWFRVKGTEHLSSLLNKDNIQKFVPKTTEAYWVVLKKPSTKKPSEFGFYSCLINDELSQKFAFYALKSGKGKIFKISCSAIKGKDPFITSSLPRMVHRKMGDDAIYRYSPQLKTIFKELSLAYSIKELQGSDMLNLMKGYDDISSEELKLCTQYLLRQKPESLPEIVRLESNDYRREDRFKIETSISILVEDKKVMGSTIDVSARGLAINLEVSDLNLKQGSEIQVTFEELNELENDFNLSNLKYKVIFSKERLLRLEVLRDKGSSAVKFWSRYIVNNISTLKIVGNEERFYGLKRALRNLVSQTYSSVPAFFTVKESRPYVRTLGLSESHSEKTFWSSAFNRFSIEDQLKPLFYDKAFLANLLSDLPEIDKSKPFYHYFLLVKYRQLQNEKLEIERVALLPTSKSVKDETRDDGEDFAVFNVSFTKKSRIYDRYFKSEMKYLETYAAHKAKKLAFEMKTVSGVLDVEDVTSFFSLFNAESIPDQ